MAKSLKYLIPAVSALSLAVAPGCADPIIGLWDVVTAFDEGIPYTYSYAGGTIEVQITSEGMEIGEEFDGDIEFSTTFTILGYGDDYSLNSKYDVNVEVLSKKTEYTITLEDSSDDFDLACTMTDKSILDCEDDDGYEWEFEKAEEE